MAIGLALGGLWGGGPCQEQNSRIHLGAGWGGCLSRKRRNPARIPGAPHRVRRLRCVPLPRPPRPHPVPGSRRPHAASGERVSSLEQGGRGQEWPEAGNSGLLWSPALTTSTPLGFPPSPCAFWLISFKLSLVGAILLGEGITATGMPTPTGRPLGPKPLVARAEGVRTLCRPSLPAS